MGVGRLVGAALEPFCLVAFALVYVCFALRVLRGRLGGRLCLVEFALAYARFASRVLGERPWGALCLVNLALAYARFALQFWRAALEAALHA